MSDDRNDGPWWEGGHASDAALAAFVDGQTAALDDAVIAHLTTCTSCSARLGDEALLSLSTGELLRDAAGAAATAPSAAGVPASKRREARAVRVALVVGVACAMAGAAPSVLDAIGHVRARPAEIAQDARTLAHALVFAGRHAADAVAPAQALVSWCVAAVAIAAGIAIARSMPRRKWTGASPAKGGS